MTVITKKYKTKKNDAVENGLPIGPSDHDAKIARLAYYKAEKRKFALGYELEEWFETEQEYSV